MAFPTVRRFRRGPTSLTDGLVYGWQQIRDKNIEGVKEFEQAMKEGLVDNSPPVDVKGNAIRPHFDKTGKRSLPNPTPMEQGGILQKPRPRGDSLLAEDMLGLTDPGDVEAITEGLVARVRRPTGPGWADSHGDFLAREYDQATGDFVPVYGNQTVVRGQDAYVLTPEQFLIERYGPDAAAQIVANYKARNEGKVFEHRDGMPEVHPEGILRNLTDPYIYTPYAKGKIIAKDGQELTSLGSANVNSRIINGLPSVMNHENYHMKHLNGLSDGRIGNQPDYGMAAWLDEFNKNSAVGNDPQRGSWLTAAVMKDGGADARDIRIARTRLRDQGSGLGFYHNQYAEMLAQAAEAKHRRLYDSNGHQSSEVRVRSRDNTFEGDQEVLDQIVNFPENEAEEAISTIFKYLPENEKNRFREMFFRLGAVAGPAALGTALMEEDQ